MNLCPVYQYVNSLMCVSIRQLTFRLIPMKTTVTIEDFAFVVTASIICEGTASADVCIVPDEDGAVGIIVADESTNTEMCNTIFYFTEGVKRYKSVCRGNVSGSFFRIKEEIDIKRIPARHLKGSN